MNPTYYRTALQWPEVTENDLRHLGLFGSEHLVRKGTNIQEVHGALLGPKLLLTGTVQTWMAFGELTLPLETLKPGAWVGCECALAQMPSVITACAMEDVRFLALTSEGTARLRASTTLLAMRLNQQMVRSLQRTMAQIVPKYEVLAAIRSTNHRPTAKDLADIGLGRLSLQVNPAV